MISVIRSWLLGVMGSCRSLNGLFSRIYTFSSKNWLVLKNTATTIWSDGSCLTCHNCLTRSDRVRYSKTFYWKAHKILQRLIPNPAHSGYTYTEVSLLQRFFKNLVQDSAVKFVKKVRIIILGCFVLFICLKSLDCKYLTISKVS